MKKIILKCKLKNRDAFEDKLAEQDLDFSPVYWQHDRVYLPRDYRPGANYPRLIMRTEMKAVDKPPKYSLILRRHIEDSGVDLLEETVVKDYEKTVNIIFQLGFKSTAEISRRRQDVKLNENTYIYLDKVENLPGYYAKIETDLEDTDSAAKVRAELTKTLATFSETNLTNSPYFELQS